MSRRYRVRVQETLRRVIKARDQVRSQLEMLDILPTEQMADLLAQELARRGFERREGSMVRKDGEVEVAVELGTGEVVVRAASEKQVQLEAEREGYSYDDAGPANKDLKQRLAEQLRQSLEKDAQKQSEQLQGQVTEHLERRLGDIAGELDQAVNRATAEALKRKAAQMGRIKQMVDDPEGGALTLVVEV